ncbi:MAG TPA: YCF48-related protein [Ignavibacteria bacterium]|nr:YCF48-related protein [Ignavibacteria bacterium]
MKNIYTLFASILFLVILNSNISFSQTTWQIINTGTIENLNSVSFPNPYVGYIAGNNGKFMKTENAGLNWTSVTPPSAGNNNLVFFVNPSVGFVSSQTGFFKTTNGGLNWVQVLLPATYAVTSVHFTSASTGWLGDFYGHVMKTTDGGTNWVIIYTMPGYRTRVFFLNDINGWAVDTYGYVIRTTNGGTGFQSQRILTDTLSQVKFISSTLGMISADSGRVFKTVNGGVNWTLINTGVTNNLTGLHYESPTKAYACGSSGIILTSVNGGTAWNSQTISQNDLYEMVFAQNTSAGWVVGEFGTAAKRVNEETMICVGSGTAQVAYPFFSYYMDSRTDMLYTAAEITAAGGGMSLITQIGFFFDSLSVQPLNGFTIKMQNTDQVSLSEFVSTGWSTVFTGTYVPSGLGTQFILLNTPFAYAQGSNLLVEICFNNSSYTLNSFVRGTVAAGKTFHNHADLNTGNGCLDLTTGSVMNTRPNICFIANPITNGGDPSNNLPKTYSLHQNYPNPFNPVTKIKFEIPKSSFVSLRVYDILGREVSVIVNETKQAGSYIIDFDASKLTSGIYFYRLNTQTFSDTKKMILIK